MALSYHEAIQAIQTHTKCLNICESLPLFDALNRIATKLADLKKKDGPDAVQFLGSAKMSNEQAYYFRKFAAFFGTNNTDHQARI